MRRLRKHSELLGERRKFSIRIKAASLPASHNGKVERNIAYVKDNALKGREFDSLQSLNSHLQT